MSLALGAHSGDTHHALDRAQFLDHPGQVHVLSIEYPSDVPQAMGLSVLEPNAAGAVMPIGLDSGLFVSDDEAENPPRLLKHSIIFWPKTKTPLLLVTNRRNGSRAVFGKITGKNHIFKSFNHEHTTFARWRHEIRCKAKTMQSCILIIACG